MEEYHPPKGCFKIKILFAVINIGTTTKRAMQFIIHICHSLEAACSVLSMSEQMVIGPTPPGTGVM